MRKYTIFFIATLFTLLSISPIIAQDAVIRWPGEKKFEGYQTLDQLRNVFTQDTSSYGRRYLIQAVPFFIEKNQITAEPPDWLVTEIIKAMKSSDPYLAVEGIVAARSLKIYSLSDTLVGIYRKARMSFIGEMPLIHMSIIGCLTAFNNAQSRNALATIVSTPLPVKIANDIVPALKALGSIGDSSCISTLTALSTRLRSQEDSITTFQRANTMVAADTMQVNRLDQMIAAVNKAENMVLARGGSK